MYLGIDLGTQSVKVILVDESGRVIRTAKEKYPIHRPQPDHVEQNPDEWWGATINAVQSATRHYTDQIKGIGVAGQMHGVVLLDKAHQPLRPAIIWMDQRSSVEVQQRTAAEWLEMAYNPLTPGMTLASLLWLKKHEPATCDAIATILLPKDWIRYKLTGSLCTELSDASGGFLLDLPRQTWSLELLALCELIPAQLPHLMRSTDVAGELISPAADVLGLPKLIPVCAGAADQAAMLVGSGVLNPGDAALTIGTGGQMSIVTDVPRPDLRLNTFAHAIRGRYYSMGAILAAGYALTWWQQIQNMPLDSMLRAAADIAPGSENLIFHPYLNGERTPHMDSRLTGTFSGLSGEHQSGHFTRAVLEGVAFAMRDCLETLHEIGAYPERMVFSGGGSKIELWGRIFASVLNTRLVTFRHSEQTALGAAMLAALSADQFQDEAEAAAAWVQQGDTIEPVAEWVPIYEERYAVY